MSYATTSTYVTIHGIPVTIELQWPFHHSKSGADFEVLHGQMRLVDGSDLFADVSVHLSQVVKETLPSLDSRDAEPIVINALRKELDRKQLEFSKSGKRQPVPLSTRFMNYKTREWQFSAATDDEIATLLRDRVYWVGYKLGAGRVNASDATEAIYTGASIERLAAVAKNLAAHRLISIDASGASATDTLIAMGSEIEARASAALRELQQKHAYEHAVEHK